MRWENPELKEIEKDVKSLDLTEIANKYNLDLVMLKRLSRSCFGSKRGDYENSALTFHQKLTDLIKNK